MTDDLPRELTIKEAAEMLGVSIETVRAYLAEGSLVFRNAAPLKSCRKMIRIPVAAVLAMRGDYQAAEKPEPKASLARRPLSRVPNILRKLPPRNG